MKFVRNLKHSHFINIIAIKGYHTTSVNRLEYRKARKIQAT